MWGFFNLRCIFGSLVQFPSIHLCLDSTRVKFKIKLVLQSGRKMLYSCLFHISALLIHGKMNFSDVRWLFCCPRLGRTLWQGQIEKGRLIPVHLDRIRLIYSSTYTSRLHYCSLHLSHLFLLLYCWWNHGQTRKLHSLKRSFNFWRMTAFMWMILMWPTSLII